MNQFRSFFETFGYIVLRNVFDKNLIDELRLAYDISTASRSGESIEEFVRKSKSALIIGGLEDSPELMSFLNNSRILPIVEDLIGDDAVYWGSDLSTFKAGSNFHRDVLGDFKFLKLGIYLQDSNEEDGGQFCCIPGSHLYGDRFSSLCSEGLLWPRGPGYVSDAFPGDFDFNNPILKNSIPTTKIELSVGDIICFDQRLVHSVPASDRMRRLLAITFLEGEKSFNARKRIDDEFAGLTHRETLATLRLAVFIVESRMGKKPIKNYSERLNEFNAGNLGKYLVFHSDDEFKDIENRVLKKSFATAYHFLTRSTYLGQFA